MQAKLIKQDGTSLTPQAIDICNYAVNGKIVTLYIVNNTEFVFSLDMFALDIDKGQPIQPPPQP